MIVLDKKAFSKLIFENLIFPHGDFVCLWNLHLNMPDYFNPSSPLGTSGKKTFSF